MAKYKFSLENLDGEIGQVAVEFGLPEEITIANLYQKLDVDHLIDVLLYFEKSTSSFKRLETEDDLDLLADGARLKVEKRLSSRKRSNSGGDIEELTSGDSQSTEETTETTRERKASKASEDSSPSEIMSQMNIKCQASTVTSPSEPAPTSSEEVKNPSPATLIIADSHSNTVHNESNNNPSAIIEKEIIMDDAPTPPLTPLVNTPLNSVPIDIPTLDNGKLLNFDCQITPEQAEKLKELFKNADTDEDGFVDMFDITSLFGDSGLEKPVLNKIWNLVDTRRNERLDETGYAFVKHLIEQILNTKKETEGELGGSTKVIIQSEDEERKNEKNIYYLLLPSSLPEEFWAKALSSSASGRRDRSMSAEEEQELEALRASRVRRNAFYNPLASNTPGAPLSVNSSLSSFAIPSLSSSGGARPTKKPKVGGLSSCVGSSSVDTANSISSSPSAESSNTEQPQECAILCESSRLRFGYADTIGKRPSMEDEMVLIGHFRGNEEEEFFSVYDGHGGNEASTFASKKLHEILIQELNETGSAKRSLKHSFLKTNTMMKEAGVRGGTTAIAALALGSKLWIANAGDCRAVICKAGQAIRASTDHKPGLPTEQKRITDLGGHITTTVDRFGNVLSRVCGVLSVARALGDFNLQPYVSPEPEIIGPFSLDPANKLYFLIMACDGVWDKVSDEEAVSIVAPIADPEKAAIKLRDYAFAQGSEDNISVMVIKFPPFLSEEVH